MIYYSHTLIHSCYLGIYDVTHTFCLKQCQYYYDVYGPSQNILRFVDDEIPNATTQNSQFDYGQFATQTQSQTFASKDDSEFIISQSQTQTDASSSFKKMRIPQHACRYTL